MRALALALILVIGLAGPATAAQAPPPVTKVGRADSYTFAFHEAAISQVAEEILGRALGLNFTVDPEVTGKISFRIEQRLTRAQLLEAFEAALAANAVVMVRSGDSLSLVPRAKAKEQAGLRMESEGAGGAGYEVVAVPLTFAIPSEAAKALDSMGRGEMVVYTDDKLGLILLGGSARELEAVGQTLKILDQSGLQDARIRWFELSQAPAMTVSGELGQILQASGATGITVVPLKRLNGILVFARTPRALDEVSAWVQKLDVPSKEEAPALWVYRPVNLSADSLANTLNAVVGGGGSAGDNGGGSAPAMPISAPAPVNGGKSASALPAAAPAPAAPAATGGGGGVHIGVSKDSNTLVITATPSAWVQIKHILDEVDRPPRQILIEGQILEVTLSNDFQFGIDWQVVAAGGKVKVGQVGNAAGVVAQQFPGLAAAYLAKDIKTALNTLKSITEVEVISAPRLVTLENKPAKLQVGDQVPISSKNAQSTDTANAPLVVNTEYRDTGVILNVTPRVSGDDQVVLDIEQEVSSVAKTTTSGIDSPTIQQRKMQSTLVLGDGKAAALGGMISSSSSKGRSGAPWLQDLPLLGLAFRSTTHEGRRTELVVLITAHIIRDPESGAKVMSDLLADLKEIQSRGLLTR